ncbi:hypothetical protein JL721_6738 [Aureococcus anophagefferens]|nr:hypothetical protein JL721_6738 [Aureococcus anophagefferens]
MDADDDLACDLEFFACAQRVAAWDVVEPDAPPPPARDRLAALERRAFVLAMALDAKYAAWRERADGYDDGDASTGATGRRRQRAVAVLFPLCFGSLVLALSLRDAAADAFFAPDAPRESFLGPFLNLYSALDVVY